MLQSGPRIQSFHSPDPWCVWKHVVVTQPDNQNCLQIVLKAYQKGEIGNFMVSLCYNFETAWTDALVCWTDIPWHGSPMQDRYFDSGLDHVLSLL